MKTLGLLALSFLLSSAAVAAILQSMPAPPRNPAPAPLPAPAPTDHYALWTTQP